jgi:hypothetical protein
LNESVPIEFEKKFIDSKLSPEAETLALTAVPLKLGTPNEGEDKPCIPPVAMASTSGVVGNEVSPSKSSS